MFFMVVIPIIRFRAKYQIQLRQGASMIYIILNLQIWIRVIEGGAGALRYMNEASLVSDMIPSVAAYVQLAFSTKSLEDTAMSGQALRSFRSRVTSGTWKSMARAVYSAS